MPGQNPFPTDNEIPQLGSDGMLGGGRNTPVAQSGQSATLGPQPNGAFEGKAELLRMQAGDERLALVASVVLTIVREANVDLGAENQTPPVKAVVTVGGGGTSMQPFEVDFVNGLVFSVPAGSLSLEAVIDTDTMDEFDVAVRVAAFATYLPRPGNTPVRRTLRTNSLVNGAAVIQELPKFASTLQVLSTTAAATYRVEQFRDRLAAQLISQTTLAAAPPYQEIPIANDTRYVRITNTSGGTVVQTSVLYRLSL